MIPAYCPTQKDGANSLNIPFPPLPDEVHGSAPSDPTSKVDERNKKSKSKQETKPPTEPKYTVVHRGEFSMQDYTNDRHSTLVRRPKELLVKVEVPGVSSAAILDVEVFEKRVVLKCKSPCYELDVSFGIKLRFLWPEVITYYIVCIIRLFQYLQFIGLGSKWGWDLRCNVD